MGTKKNSKRRQQSEKINNPPPEAKGQVNPDWPLVTLTGIAPNRLYFDYRGDVPDKLPMARDSYGYSRLLEWMTPPRNKSLDPTAVQLPFREYKGIELFLPVESQTLARLFVIFNNLIAIRDLFAKTESPEARQFVVETLHGAAASAICSLEYLNILYPNQVRQVGQDNLEWPLLRRHRDATPVEERLEDFGVKDKIKGSLKTSSQQIAWNLYEVLSDNQLVAQHANEWNDYCRNNPHGPVAIGKLPDWVKQCATLPPFNEQSAKREWWPVAEKALASIGDILQIVRFRPRPGREETTTTGSIYHKKGYKDYDLRGPLRQAVKRNFISLAKTFPDISHGAH